MISGIIGSSSTSEECYRRTAPWSSDVSRAMTAVGLTKQVLARSTMYQDGLILSLDRLLSSTKCNLQEGQVENHLCHAGLSFYEYVRAAKTRPSHAEPCRAQVQIKFLT